MQKALEFIYGVRSRYLFMFSGLTAIFCMFGNAGYACANSCQGIISTPGEAKELQRLKELLSNYCREGGACRYLSFRPILSMRTVGFLGRSSINGR